MNMQTINLYQDVLKPPRKPREDVMLLGGAVASVVFCAVYTGWLIVSSDRLVEAVTLAEESKQVLEASVEDLRAQMGTRRADPLLIQENERLKEQIKKAEILAGLIEQNQVLETGNIAFGEILRAYAKNSQMHLWLDHIQVSEAGRDLQLGGLFSQQDALTAFLGQLKGDPSFVGRSFNHMEVKPEDGKPLLRFALDTRANVKAVEKPDDVEPDVSPIEKVKQLEADDE